MQYTLVSSPVGVGATSSLSSDTSACKVERRAKGVWTNPDPQVTLRPSFQDFLAEQSAAIQQSLETGPGGAASQPTREILHTVKKGDTIWALAHKTYHADPEAIMRLNGILEPGALQVGQQLRIPVKAGSSGAPPAAEVVASWYGRHHHGLSMANGERFDMDAATIAHRKLPLGAKVELENPKTGEKVQAVVTDRGPYVKGRDVDISYGAAKRLSLVKQGVGKLHLRIL